MRRLVRNCVNKRQKDSRPRDFGCALLSGESGVIRLRNKPFCERKACFAFRGFTVLDPMKICAWCGTENEGSALNCRGCGTSQFKSTGPVLPKSPSGGGPAFKDADAETKVDFARHLAAATPKAWVTPAIIGLNIILFLILSADSQSLFSPPITKLVAWGANFGPLTITGHEWWRLITSCFVHIGLLHVLFNMYALFQAGKLTEKLFGNWFFLLIYLASGLAGSLTSVWFNPLFVSAGASGAIFGVYGALLGYMAREGRGLPRGTAK